MIKNYIIEGQKFKTIIIPKGTILFRGLNFENDSRYMSLFNDFVGFENNKYYSIAPTMNVFFYPVPYVSDSVKIYDIHIMFITQYDIELLLLINPSNISRSNKSGGIYDKIFKLCSDISEKDKCGHEMSRVDPCFTDIMLKRFPQIDGYISLAEQDSELFTKLFQKMVNHDDEIGKAKHILPSILSNSRGIIGIPEIVIHPLHFRYDDCVIIKDRFFSPKSVINYCIKNRPIYNYFPLLYFTNNDIFTFTELTDKQIIKKIANSTRVYNVKPKIYENIDKVFSQMLDKGYKINKSIFRVFIDNRTGFYRTFIEKNKELRNTTSKKVLRNFKDDNFNGYINSYIISPKNEMLNSIIVSHTNYLNNFINELNMNGYSIKKKMLLDRGNKNKLIYNYYIDKVLDRPDLEEYVQKRKRKQNITRKNIENRFTQLLMFNGFTQENLNEIEI